MKKYRDGLNAMVDRLFGDKVDEMALLGGIATSPEYQGRGYGTALMHLTIDLVRDRLTTKFRPKAILISLIAGGQARSRHVADI